MFLEYICIFLATISGYSYNFTKRLCVKIKRTYIKSSICDCLNLSTVNRNTLLRQTYKGLILNVLTNYVKSDKGQVSKKSGKSMQESSAEDGRSISF